MVIFFRLTNSLAIFQTMMNKILQDLIDIGEVTSFIDDVIVEIKKKEEYNNIVEEIVERLVENDLYIKTREV